MKPCFKMNRTVRAAASPREGLTRRVQIFQRDEDGSLIIFSLFMFILMLIIAGMSLDIERFETARTKLQNTADAASLAAASLSQDVSAVTLVNDYFTKVGMEQFIENIVVDEAVNYKRVQVDTDINVPTHFFSMIGIENLATVVQSTAEESIGDVEISLVLDVSGSMGSNSKLVNLKNAAEDFIDSVYGSTADDSVSTTIVPYSTQVSAGPDLLALMNRTPVSHEYSHCLNFTENDYLTTEVSLADPVEQTLHFDPWTRENSSWTPNNSLPSIVCPTASWTDIKAYSDDPDALKAYVNAFQATNWTSIELGVKWGAALLDPTFQPVVTGLIGAGAVNAAFAGRPIAYTNNEGLKVMVVMTDGINTEQYEMENPYRTGNSFVYVYYDNWDRPYYSIWGGSGEPDPTVQTVAVTTTDTQCTYWYRSGGRWRCGNWETVTTTTYEEAQNWYLANDYSSDGVSDGWKSAPHGGADATRMTWNQLWAEVPVEYFTDKYLYNMGYSSTIRNAIKNARNKIQGNEKDDRTADICTTAKTAGVIIYAIGFEAPYASQVLLAGCASSPSHYFNVEGTDISMAFSAIAADINRLRLIQ